MQEKKLVTVDKREVGENFTPTMWVETETGVKSIVKWNGTVRSVSIPHGAKYRLCSAGITGMEITHKGDWQIAEV